MFTALNWQDGWKYQTRNESQSQCHIREEKLFWLSKELRFFRYQIRIFLWYISVLMPILLHCRWSIMLNRVAPFSTVDDQCNSQIKLTQTRVWLICRIIMFCTVAQVGLYPNFGGAPSFSLFQWGNNGVSTTWERRTVRSQNYFWIKS